MKVIPQALLKKFDSSLNERSVEPGLQKYFRKWLRFYLDFCHKYKNDPERPDSLPLFIEKLREKNQTRQQQKQAYNSILIYYELHGIHPDWSKKPFARQEVREDRAAYKPVSVPNQKQWAEVYQKMSDEIRVRHYSSKTLKAYATWTRKFQQFVKNRLPESLETEDVKAFLTNLAVKSLGIRMTWWSKTALRPTGCAWLNA